MKASASQPSLSQGRKILFTTIALILSFLLLLLLEGGLRLVGYGKSLPLFITEGAPQGYLQPNPDVIQRYFPVPEVAPAVSPDTVFFKETKATETFRIFVQGGSTAAGFPYGRWGSLQGMVEQRYKRLYPDTKIEVINTAMAAVNSYTILDFVDEIIEQKPDLVLIYAGHNEYLGVFGAGSVYAGKGGRSATLLYLALKEWRIVQLLERSVFSFSGVSAEKTDNKRALMATVAKGKEIPLGGELYQAGITQFRENMSLILDKYQEKSIPVVIGTLASNERDQVPFNSVGEVNWREYEVSLQKNPQQFVPDENEITSAADAYKAGLYYFHQENYERARTYFQQASDLDSIRFRAPTEFNTIIRKLAEQDGVYLADVNAFISKDSEHGIIGKKHMLEHLHPTARGYFMLGEAYVDTVANQASVLGLPLSVPKKTQELAWQNVPITRVAERYGEFKIAGLVGDYPFTDTKQPAPGLEGNDFESRATRMRATGKSWVDIQKSLVKEYQKVRNLNEASKISGNLSDAFVMEPGYAITAGKLYRMAKDYELSRFYFERARALDSANTGVMLDLAHTLFLLNDISSSMELLQEVLTIDPNNGNAKKYLAKMRSHPANVQK